MNRPTISDLFFVQSSIFLSILRTKEQNGESNCETIDNMNLENLAKLQLSNCGYDLTLNSQLIYKYMCMLVKLCLKRGSRTRTLWQHSSRGHFESCLHFNGTIFISSFDTAEKQSNGINIL